MRVEVLMEASASGVACVYTGLDQRNFETISESIQVNLSSFIIQDASSDGALSGWTFCLAEK
jgi:hypothetical protein